MAVSEHMCWKHQLCSTNGRKQSVCWILIFFALLSFGRQDMRSIDLQQLKDHRQTRRSRYPCLLGCECCVAGGVCTSGLRLSTLQRPMAQCANGDVDGQGKAHAEDCVCSRSLPPVFTTGIHGLSISYCTIPFFPNAGPVPQQLQQASLRKGH